MQLPRPAFGGSGSEEEYAAHLGDAAYWSPYIEEALRRHGLPAESVTAGTVGSSPTFLAGHYVVKLFPELFEGAICFQTDREILHLLSHHQHILAPSLIADGALFGETPQSAEATPTGPGWPWPYLVSMRVAGTSWHESQLTHAEALAVAGQLGTVMRQLHALPPPTGPLWERDWLAEYRRTCVERQRRFGLLPPHLIEQIDSYLAPPSSERRLLHADLHDHHLFVAEGQLTGIIDWGDAIVADPYHELPALHLHTFNADTRLLASFLDGYRWLAHPDFERLAMSATLAYPFNVLDRVAQAVDLRQFDTLDALAAYIWRIP